MAFTVVHLRLCVLYVGLGSMPSATAMRQIPRISDASTVADTSTATNPGHGWEALGLIAIPLGESAAALMGNMLLQANTDLNTLAQGVYVGEGCMTDLECLDACRMPPNGAHSVPTTP